MPISSDLVIKLVRHGESLSNTGDVLPHESGDAWIDLSEKGRNQARVAGAALGPEFITGATLYTSPYLRTRETIKALLEGAGVQGTTAIYEDPRLREVERGYLPEARQHELRKVHGWFYYRHDGGESPADCYDRTSAFLESMMRGASRNETKKILIVTHGMTIRCFVMRFLHLTVEAFESMANPANCEVVTIAPISKLEAPVFSSKRWGVVGLGLRQRPAAPESNPEAILTRQTLFLEANEVFSESDRRALQGRMLIEPSLSDVLDMGKKVFEDDAKFARWLVRPHSFLGGVTPLSILLSGDISIVEDELGRIEYGELLA